jgi:hypothetical protein
MLIKLLKQKLSGNFIFDGILLMFINFVLLFSFGIIFGFLLLSRIILARYGRELPFSPQTVIILFALISIYIWFIFGHELRRVLTSNKLLKALIINLIGASPIMLVFIYENLLIGLKETRSSGGCVGGLIVFSSIAIGSMVFQLVALLGGVVWGRKTS